MSPSLKPYRDRKDSGLDWIGSIPAHWEVARNGRLFEQRIETGRPELPVLEISVRTGIRVRNLDGPGRKQAMSDRSQYKVARRGDIAYNMMRMWQGAVGVAPVDGLVSPAYVVARARAALDPRYYAYLFRTNAYMEEVNRRSRGIVKDRNRLYWLDFKQIPSLLPPFEEQVQIADFLDRHGRALSHLIRMKQRLIGLLNRQKEAVIQAAVTRGLNPDVPLRPSGVEWVGDVPHHWRSLRTKHVSQLNPGKRALNGLSDDAIGSFLPMEAVGEWGALDLSDHISVGEGRSGYTYVQDGDVLIAKITPCFENGKGALCRGLHEGIGFASTEFYVLRAGSLVDPLYLYYVTRSPGYRLLGAEVMQGAAGQKRVPRDFVMNVEIPIPPFAEQTVIVQELDRKLLALNSVIDRLAQEIGLIEEYRTRLIADVVTGKLDIWGVEMPDIDHAREHGRDGEDVAHDHLLAYAGE